MGFAMQPAGRGGGGWPESYERAPGSDQTYPRGCPVAWDASSQELDIHAGGATVTNIAGVSLEGVVAGVADNPSGKVAFAHAAHPNLFVAKLSSAGTIVAPDTANIGVQYGIIVVGSGSTQYWTVDEADTSNVVCEVVDIDTERNVVFFKFLDSAVQLSGSYD